MNPTHHSGSKGIVFAKPVTAEPTRKPSADQKKHNKNRQRIEAINEEKRLNNDCDFSF